MCKFAMDLQPVHVSFCKSFFRRPNTHFLLSVYKPEMVSEHVETFDCLLFTVLWSFLHGYCCDCISYSLE